MYSVLYCNEVLFMIIKYDFITSLTTKLERIYRTIFGNAWERFEKILHSFSSLTELMFYCRYIWDLYCFDKCVSLKLTFVMGDVQLVRRSF